MKNKLTIKSRLWIISQEETFLGEGRVALLLAISDLGSISKAAKSMNMSYLKAWKLVESMNKASPQPLVERSTGGKHGGGTTLTKQGQKVIQLFKNLTKAHDQYLNQKLEKHLREF